MKKFTEKLDISKVVVPISEMEIVDPGVMKDKESQFYELSKHSRKRLADITSMRSAQFSATLYGVDADIWKALLSKKLQIKEVQDSLKQNNAVMIDDMVVTIVEGDNHIEEVVNAINQFVEDPDLTTYYKLYDKDQLIVISTNDKGYGVVIWYYLQGNWITVQDCYFDPAKWTILIAPYKELDVKVDESIGDLMNKDQLMTMAAATMSTQIEAYSTRLTETAMSVDEVCWHMKKFFKIKLGVDKFNVLDYATDHEWLSGRSTDLLAKVVDKFYESTENPMLVNSAYLKKAISMTKVTWGDFSDLLVSVFLDDEMHLGIVADVQGRCIDRDTHFNQLGLDLQ